MAGIFGYVPNNTLGALYLAPQTGNEAIWRQALANQGSISRPRPSLGGRLENLTVDTLRKAGVSDRAAARLGSKTFRAVNDLTPVGNLTGADEGAAQFGRGLTRGDLGQAALGAGIFGLSVFPGAAGRVVGKVGKGMFGRLMRDESGAIRAWHGSPHDFDKFSLSKIGTGEGAQAYGHGLYFAENKRVAEEYQNALSKPKVGDRDMTNPEYWAYGLLNSRFNGDVRAAAEHAAQRAAHGFSGASKADLKSWQDQANVLKSWRDNGLPEFGSNGRLYEVNINAEPQDFLDWDAPVAAQPRVMDYVQRRWGDDPARVFGRFGLNSPATTEGAEFKAFMDGMANNQVAGREKLLDAGLPGIRYLDQGSRGKGGTRNYVVFDDSLIDILNKY